MGGFKVYVSRCDVLKEALDLLKEKGCELIIPTEPGNCGNPPRAQLLKNVQGVDAIFCSSPSSVRVDEELLQAAGPNLKVIGTVSVGYDHINLEAAKRHNVKIGYTPNVLTDTVAELTVAVLLATSRRLFEGNRALLSGKWVWTPTWLCGMGLKNSTVGIFGMGRIGQAVISRLVPFGVSKFIYTSRSPKREVTNAEFVSFETLLSNSDFLIVTASLTDETKYTFNEAAFQKMKKNSIIVNTSRGELINQDDLVQALKTGQIGGAGLDVMTPEPLPPDHELTKLDNCVLIPHLGSAETETRIGMATLTARNILAALNGTEMEARLC